MTTNHTASDVERARRRAADTAANLQSLIKRTDSHLAFELGRQLRANPTANLHEILARMRKGPEPLRRLVANAESAGLLPPPPSGPVTEDRAQEDPAPAGIP